MKARWGLVLLFPALASLVLLVASQGAFLYGSLFRDLRLGRMGTDLTFINYLRIFGDDYYLGTLWLTIRLSFWATVITFVVGFPVAYAIARMRSRWAMVMLASIVLSSLISIVIKVLGLLIVFSSNSIFNQWLMALDIIAEPYSILGRETGVVIGLVHFTLGFGVLVVYSMVQTIPRSLEEAARIMGASRRRIFQRVILPLCLPGLIAGSLTVFNLCMGAFTSAALIGGGRVITMPVMIQRTIILETKYAMAAALSATLLVAVLLINLLSILILRRFRYGRQATA